MNTEIYIENYKLDLSKDLSALLTFEMDDIRDFSSRSTTWSKTIVLPGTANNNKLFGHIFQTGQSNTYNDALTNVGYNFNASKSANCIIFQESIQTFKGVLRLLQVNIDQGQIEYEVAVFGEITGLSVALSSGLLEDLDFSNYDHTYNAEIIVASWDYPSGSGVYYPLIDYGSYSLLKHDWDIRTFRPALYVKEYIDKMFEAAGFRYSSALFETDRFKKLIVPNPQKALQQFSSPFIEATSSGDDYLIFEDPLTSNFGFLSVDVSTNAFDFTHPNFTYTPISPATFDIYFDVQGLAHRYTGFDGLTFYFDIYKNDILLQTQSFSYAGVSDAPFHETFNISGVQILQNDIIHIVVRKTAGADVGLTGVSSTFSVTTTDEVLTDIIIGDQVSVNYSIPKNIRQVDFLVSIVKLFNLYVYEDKFDEKLIYITPYVDFFPLESSGCVDWTYKLNRNKPVKVKPMSELNAKIYEFKYKSDSDYFNDLYKKRYGQDYGNRIYDSDYEFSEQKKSFEIIFSPSPLTSTLGEDKVFSAIYKLSGETEERIDSNIRILQAKKITGVASWNILDGVSVLDSLTKYGYAGHFDDPITPTNDLNFGLVKEVFYSLDGLSELEVNQFNIYWSPYMAEITDKDSKLFTGNFYLTPKDIFNLDFSKFIMVDGVLFRLNKIIDYNMSEPDDCKVELLKVQYLIY